jgi:hypothetical protein
VGSVHQQMHAKRNNSVAFAIICPFDHGEWRLWRQSMESVPFAWAEYLAPAWLDDVITENSPVWLRGRLGVPHTGIPQEPMVFPTQSRAQIHICVFMLSIRYCPVFTKILTWRQIWVKLPNVRFRENAFIGSVIVACDQTDRHVAKIIGASFYQLPERDSIPWSQFSGDRRLHAKPLQKMEFVMK